ncbi:MAG: glycosyltransferase [Planctomycetota bacterium]
MSIAFTMWFILAGGIGLVWLVRLLSLVPILRRRCILKPRAYQGPPQNAPRISILVAARDEEDNIEACVTTLLDQDYPNFQLIVVDDRSRDGTPAILSRLHRQAGLPGQGGSRLRVVTVRELAEGWFGKSHAMHEGVAVSDGDWLLFTDADCRQLSRHTLSIAMDEALTQRTDFLTIIPMLETRTAWERIIQPVCSLVMAFWFMPDRVNDPEKPTAYANGAFMLMSRRCYDAIGGHEHVRNRLNEDIELARLAKTAGMRLRVVENHGLYQTRMYPTLRQAWRGWSRIFAGALGSPFRVAMAGSLIVLLGLVPWASLFAAVIGLISSSADSADPWSAALAAWGVVIVLEQYVLARFYSVVGIQRVWSATYVLGGTIMVAILVNALFKILGATTTTWRSTTYRGACAVEVPDESARAPQPPVQPIVEPGTPL